MKFPKNIAMTIDRNEHEICYQSVESYCSDNDVEISTEELQQAIKTNELWIIRWYPTNPVGFHQVAASTLEKAVELANQ